ncbi:MAG: polyprenyl synthetase family protein [Lachnospiraceae bacterium]|nr:polyprenyl synthetase family protein [Lachnospiraceae bacterium]
MQNMEDFNKTLSEKVAVIDKIIADRLPEVTGLQKLVFEAMEYSVTAGGKRIRPLLLKEAYELFKGNECCVKSDAAACEKADAADTDETVKVFMAALEYIHNYSLVHDDLPAMDNDMFRRNRKTTHAVYGAGMGTLTGDALLNYAFEIIADELEKNMTIETVKSFNILSKKAGVYGMIGGQVVDVSESGNALNEEQIDFIYRLKTSALIEAPLMIGATLAGASNEVVNEMETVGRNVGLAFQIQDDILDITSTDEVLGKPVHSDEKNEKTTFVTIHGLEESKKYVEDYSKEAIEIISKYGEKADFLKNLFYMMIDRKK